MHFARNGNKRKKGFRAGDHAFIAGAALFLIDYRKSIPHFDRAEGTHFFAITETKASEHAFFLAAQKHIRGDAIFYALVNKAVLYFGAVTMHAGRLFCFFNISPDRLLCLFLAWMDVLFWRYLDRGGHEPPL